MKMIGRTTDGDIITQMSEREYTSLSALGEIFNGSTVASMMDGPFLTQTRDLENPIKAVRVYMQGLELVNALQDHLDSMRKILKNEI